MIYWWVIRTNIFYANLVPLFFLLPTTFIYLAFKYFFFERTWWILFQKRVARTNFDIYYFIMQVLVGFVLLDL
jgi:TRAP-type mannitol/chloroaromatic compound transport system permease small subunit